MNQTNAVLVAGATGQIGSSIALHLSRQSNWISSGLSRRAQPEGAYPILAVDLLDEGECRRLLQAVPRVTHLVYAARYDHAGGQLESVDVNLHMLSNLLGALQDRPELRHIHVVHGTKYYGHNTGAAPVPYSEDAERGSRPIFYYAQQDLLVRQQVGRSWNWTISRPHTFCDLVTHEPRSITLLVAIYASILKERGLALRFPGTERAFHARTQFTWLPMLARSIEWMMSEATCANQAFNIVNGDPQQWLTLWQFIADYFNMDCGEAAPQRLAHFPDLNQEVWRNMTSTYCLQSGDLHSLVQWAYGDYVFSPQWDVVSSMDKARAYGFSEGVNTIDMWRDSFDFYRAHNIIP